MGFPVWIASSIAIGFGIFALFLTYRHWAQRRAQQRMQEELSTILCDYMPVSGLEMDELNNKRAQIKLREALV